MGSGWSQGWNKFKHDAAEGLDPLHLFHGRYQTHQDIQAALGPLQVDPQQAITSAQFKSEANKALWPDANEDNIPDSSQLTTGAGSKNEYNPISMVQSVLNSTSKDGDLVKRYSYYFKSSQATSTSQTTSKCSFTLPVPLTLSNPSNRFEMIVPSINVPLCFDQWNSSNRNFTGTLLAPITYLTMPYNLPSQNFFFQMSSSFNNNVWTDVYVGIPFLPATLRSQVFAQFALFLNIYCNAAGGIMEQWSTPTSTPYCQWTIIDNGTTSPLTFAFYVRDNYPLNPIAWPHTVNVRFNDPIGNSLQSYAYMGFIPEDNFSFTTGPNQPPSQYAYFNTPRPSLVNPTVTPLSLSIPTGNYDIGTFADSVVSAIESACSTYALDIEWLYNPTSNRFQWRIKSANANLELSFDNTPTVQPIFNALGFRSDLNFQYSGSVGSYYTGPYNVNTNPIMNIYLACYSWKQTSCYQATHGSIESSSVIAEIPITRGNFYYNPSEIVNPLRVSSTITTISELSFELLNGLESLPNFDQPYSFTVIIEEVINKPAVNNLYNSSSKAGQAISGVGVLDFPPINVPLEFTPYVPKPPIGGETTEERLAKEKDKLKNLVTMAKTQFKRKLPNDVQNAIKKAKDRISDINNQLSNSVVGQTSSETNKEPSEETSS